MQQDGAVSIWNVLRWWQISLMASNGILGIGFSSSWRANSTSVSSRRGGVVVKVVSDGEMSQTWNQDTKCWNRLRLNVQSWNLCNFSLLVFDFPLTHCFICIAGRRMCCLLGSAHFYLLASLWSHSNVLSMPVPYCSNISEKWGHKLQVT